MMDQIPMLHDNDTASDDICEVAEPQDNGANGSSMDNNRRNRVLR